jgi:hypothetical protein
VRELSEIAMTGAAWITEYELHYIVNRVRELESDEEFYICKNNEYVEQITRLEAEKEGWKETAKQHCKNEDYYRGLVQEIGKHFGAYAYTSDDGSIQQDILCAKVPDLVARDNTRLWELEAERDRLKAEIERQKMLDLSGECDRLRARHAALVEKYNELLYSVGNKYPDESRHETALRYIRNAETPKDNVAHCERAALEVKP